MNPLKLFVYAAHQAPIVSTDIPNLDDRLANLFVARSAHDFIEQIRAIVSGRLSLIGCTDYRVKNSWESRFKDAVSVIFEGRGLRRASSV